MNRIKKNQTRVVLVFIVFTSSIACSNPTEPEKAWDWFAIPTIEFLTQNWEYPAKSYVSGDSLTIALTSLAGHANPSRMGLLVSASGDSEDVNFFNGQQPIPFPFGLIAIYTTVGKRFPSRAAAQHQSWNGVLEIADSNERVVISYRLSDPQETILWDSVLFRK